METIDLKKKAIASYKALTTTVHVGEEVFAMLEQEGFQAGWDRLYDTCPWATVFQSRAYVATWFRVYREKHLPILIQSVEGGKLKGLLAVAQLNGGSQGGQRKNKKGRIVGAGHFDAEYQTWLAEEAGGDHFIREALLQLEKHFPGHEIRFRYLPSQTPLAWIEANSRGKSACVLQAFRRPLLDISEANISKLLQKQEFKRKFSRLKKGRVLRFERILDKETFVSVIDELVTQFDFRQSARFNKNNFRDDPLKKTLLLEMLEQNLLHISVLKVNEKIYASVVGIAGKGCLHLSGINTHSPLKAKYYSPGNLHFTLLSQQLYREGIAEFDLTPGGDSYKDRLATRYDEVHELLVSHSFTSRLKRQLRKQAYSLMIKAGIWPMGMEVSLRKRLYLFKAWLKMLRKRGVFHYLIDRSKVLIKPGKQLAYLFRNNHQMLSSALTVKSDSLEDLLDFEARGTWTTRWEFLEGAMHRLELGERAYTWSEGGRLLGCAWLGEGPTPGTHPAKGQPVAKAAQLLQQVYCHPAGRNRLEDFMAAVAADAASDRAALPLYALVPYGDKALCRALEATGFQQIAASER